MKAFIVSLLIAIVCSTSALADELPAPNALLNLIAFHFKQIEKDPANPASIYSGKTVAVALSKELKGDNNIKHECLKESQNDATTKFNCFVMITRIPSSAGVIRFSFGLVQFKSGVAALFGGIKVYEN